MVRANRPQHAPTYDERHGKDDAHDQLGLGEGIAQPDDAELVVKVGQHAQNARADLANAHEEDGKHVTTARVHGPPCRCSREQVMEDEDDAVVPYPRIVRVLDLVGQEQEEGLLGGGMVRVHPSLVGGRTHGIGPSKGVRPDFVQYVRVADAHDGDGQAGHGIDANVAGEDVPIPFALGEKGMDVLVRFEDVTEGLLDDN